MSRAETEQDILDLLAHRDMTTVAIANHLALSIKWIYALLNEMPERAHCIAAPAHLGMYRIGPAPAGWRVIAPHSAERTEQRILAAIAHGGKTVTQIACETGISRKYIAQRIAALGGKVDLIGRDTRGAVYRASDWTPAPVSPRIVLPGWAAALAC